jgi:C_GCAxxG_C_C family probable redox protein
MSKDLKIAEQKFIAGLYCAESVVSTVAENLGIESPLIPGIATGFCSGMARTSGTCGALTGGILGLNLALGRNTSAESVESNYAAVQTLVEKFQENFGSTNCKELLGCNLGTEEGQQAFNAKNLGNRCQKFTGKAAEIAISIIDANQKP